MKVSMLTTVDNPYDPFDDYDHWYSWDLLKGYHTPGYLARITNLSDELSEVDLNLEVDQAIDKIVELNPSGIYRKVSREMEEDEF